MRDTAVLFISVLYYCRKYIITIELWFKSWLLLSHPGMSEWVIWMIERSVGVILAVTFLKDQLKKLSLRLRANPHLQTATLTGMTFPFV